MLKRITKSINLDAFNRGRIRDALSWALLTSLVGCGEGDVTSQFRTSTPAEAAASAVEQFDKDGDGQLSLEETEASPPLTVAFARLDEDRDKSLSASEIEARFQQHDDMSDVVAFTVSVVDRNQPLSDAQITFAPAPFMGQGKQSYMGTTDSAGDCNLQGEEVKLVGLPTGFYDVHIMHASSGVDQKMGCEVADDLPTANRMVFDVAEGGGPRTGAGRGQGR